MDEKMHDKLFKNIDYNTDPSFSWADPNPNLPTPAGKKRYVHTRMHACTPHGTVRLEELYLDERHVALRGEPTANCGNSVSSLFEIVPGLVSKRHPKRLVCVLETSFVLTVKRASAYGLHDRVGCVFGQSRRRSELQFREQ